MRNGLAALAVGALFVGASSANAGVEEVKVGLTAHNIQVIDDKNTGKEDGPNLSAQVNFSSLGFLRWAGGPRPYLYASINLAGETSFGGGGLAWRIPFAQNWALEPGLGYVIHNGETTNPFRNGDPRATRFSNENVLLGSEDLFQTQIALTRSFGGGWNAQLYYEHLSHGQILGDGRNQGLDNAGVRIGYRFGG